MWLICQFFLDCGFETQKLGFLKMFIEGFNHMYPTNKETFNHLQYISFICLTIVIYQGVGLFLLHNDIQEEPLRDGRYSEEELNA